MTEPDQTFTLEQIKKAFFEEFTGSGELWFSYLCKKHERAEFVLPYWTSFLENLTGVYSRDETILEDKQMTLNRRGHIVYDPLFESGG